MKINLKNYLALVIIVIGLGSCSKSTSDVTGGNPPPTPGANEVWMQNTSFVPSTKTIAVGTTITWTNKDAATHDVKSNTAGLFASPSMGQGATFSYTFTTAGTYGYTCVFHSGMNGTIVVQ